MMASALLFLAGCSDTTTADETVRLVEEEDSESFAEVTVDYADVEKRILLNGTYTSTEEVELSFPVSDRLIVWVGPKKGDFVSKGELVAELEVGELEEKIADQEYQIKSMELSQKQTRELYDFDLTSAETLYSSTAKTSEDEKQYLKRRQSIDRQYQDSLQDLDDKIALAKRRLQEYKEELQNGRLISTISGEVTFMSGSLQDTYCKEGTVIATVSNTDACYFVVDGTEYASYFEEGKSVRVDYQEGMQKKSVEAVLEPVGEGDTAMYFAPVGEEVIKVGTGGNIDLLLEQKSHVLCIPRKALHESDQGPFVYLSENGMLKMQYVTVGIEGTDRVEIVDGLKQGDTVALKK